MNQEIKARIATVREQIERLRKHGSYTSVLDRVDDNLKNAELYLNSVNEKVLVVLGLIRQDLDSFEAGESVSPYGAWCHSVPFKRIRDGLQGGLPL